jgi:hypothetical protein
MPTEAVSLLHVMGPQAPCRKIEAKQYAGILTDIHEGFFWKRGNKENCKSTEEKQVNSNCV